MKKITTIILIVTLLLSLFVSCKPNKEKHTESFLNYFDTVSTITGYEKDVKEFDMVSEKVEVLLKEYHELFDIYNTYENKNNIKTINDNAGISAVKVDKKIIELLDFSKEIFELTDGKTDITMGSVLKIWHYYRTEGNNDPSSAIIPSLEELKKASQHKGFDNIQIDEENQTVFITDNSISIDVGAVAKGYATEKIAEQLTNDGISGYGLNIGGNIRIIGDKPNGKKWTASVSNPNGEGTLMTIRLDSNSFVTSGSNMRYYDVNGIRYHHIIDTETLFPKNEFSSVSVLTDDSGKADALSTALFCLDYEKGLKLINSMQSTEAVWVKPDGSILYSDGINNSIIKE